MARPSRSDSAPAPTPEGTDAIAVIISEERGKISIAHEGRLIFEVDPETLQAALIELFQPTISLRRAASLLPGWLTPPRGARAATRRGGPPGRPVWTRSYVDERRPRPICRA